MLIIMIFIIAAAITVAIAVIPLDFIHLLNYIPPRTPPHPPSDLVTATKFPRPTLSLIDKGAYWYISDPPLPNSNRRTQCRNYSRHCKGKKR